MRFFRRSRAANSEVSGRILPKFELIEAFIVVLVTCKNEEDPIKNEGARVLTRFSPLQVYGNFFRRSRAANSAVLGRIWSNFELVQDIMAVLVTCKYEEDPIKNEDARVLTRFSSLLPYGSYPLPWKPEYQSDLTKNLMQPFPHPNDALDKIWLQSVHWSQRY